MMPKIVSLAHVLKLKFLNLNLQSVHFELFFRLEIDKTTPIGQWALCQSLVILFNK